MREFAARGADLPWRQSPMVAPRQRSVTEFEWRRVLFVENFGAAWLVRAMPGERGGGEDVEEAVHGGARAYRRHRSRDGWNGWGDAVRR